MRDQTALLQRHETHGRADVDGSVRVGSLEAMADVSPWDRARTAAPVHPRFLVCADAVTLKRVEAAFSRPLVAGMPSTDTSAFALEATAQASTIHAIELFKDLIDLTLYLKGAAQFPDVLYLRPRLFRYPDGVAALAFGGKRCVALQKLLILCDDLLCAGEVVELESLYHGDDAAGRTLSRWLGAARTDVHDAHFDAPAFGKAILSVATSLRTSLGDASALLPLGSAKAVRKGEPSTLFLGRGWCEPEPHFVWSVGSLSQIHLPVARSRGRKRCLLRGMRVTTDVKVEVSVNGGKAPCLFFANQPGSDYDILIELGAVEGGTVRIDLRFPTTVSPNSQDPGNGDTRALAFAIHGIRLSEVDRPRHVGWTGRDVAEADVFGSALIYAAWNDPSANEALVRGTGRVLARRVVGDGQPTSSRGTDLATWQGGVEGFLHMLEQEGETIELIVGPDRVDEFLAAADRFTGLSAWLRVCFLIAVEPIRENLRGWIHEARYTMVVEDSRILAVPEPLTN